MKQKIFFDDLGNTIWSLEMRKVDPDKNQRKFYNIYLYQTESSFIVMTQRGRIGNKPATQIHEFFDRTEAEKLFEEKKKEKAKKKYVQYEEEMLPISFFDFPMKDISSKKKSSPRKNKEEKEVKSIQLDFF